MPKISFKSWEQVVEFHNPMINGELDRQTIEVRLDPLTGSQSVLNYGFKDKFSMAYPPTDYVYLQQRFEETREKCFMCHGEWLKMSPRYPERIIPGGWLSRGEAALFPNLFPLAPYHAIVRVGEKHGRTLDDFPSSLLFDAFSLCLDFIGRCFKADPQIRFFTINVNFMPPAGGSILHPHIQIMGCFIPSTFLRLMLERSLAYYRDNGSNYWMDLIESEKESGQRWVGQTGPSGWFTAFSPIGANEVDAVWPDKANFIEWDDRDVQALAEGLRRALVAYHSLNISSFNLSCFSGPLGENAPEFSCVLRLISRQNMVPNYISDDFFMQKLHKDELIMHPPEQLASLMKEVWGSE